MLLVVQYSYSDTASCLHSSLTKFTASPLNTSCTTSTDGSYRTICSDGVYQTLQYSDAKCTDLFVTNSMSPTACQDGNMLRCVSGPAPPPTPPTPPTAPSFITSDIFYQAYSTADCTGPALYTNGFVRNLCAPEGSGSYKFTCNNNIPTRYYYNSSTTCSGKPSSLHPLSATCSTSSR